MFSLSISSEARRDLDEIWDAGDTDEAARIEAFLEQASVDQSILDSLLVDHFDNGQYTVRKWLEFWNRGRNLWRVRILNFPAVDGQYRIIYAYDPRPRRFYVLGIVHRDFDYDSQDDRSRRILRDYENLDITEY